MKKRGMGAATKGGGCCMGGMKVKKYSGGGFAAEGITEDMRQNLPGVTRSLLRGKGTGKPRKKRTTMTVRGRTLPYEPSVPR
jgi:hypothetical protein